MDEEETTVPVTTVPARPKGPAQPTVPVKITVPVQQVVTVQKTAKWIKIWMLISVGFVAWGIVKITAVSQGHEMEGLQGGAFLGLGFLSFIVARVVQWWKHG
jgi:hypothetical protein